MMLAGGNGQMRDIETPGEPPSGIVSDSVKHSLPPHQIQKKLSGCILWYGARGSGGYGQRRFRGKSTSAHRAAWIEARGEVSPDLEVDHLCENRRCVNLEHLELVTHTENQRRASLRRTRCKRGHLKPPGSCKKCIKEYQQTSEFKAAVRKWESEHRNERNTYQREWQKKRRANLNVGRA